MSAAITKIYQVFSDKKQNLSGNTSAVILSDSSLSDQQMQQIAADFCQPATTFLFSGNRRNKYEVRWFAPDAEIELCGHGSMAAVAFLSEQLKSDDTFILHSKGGVVTGKNESKEVCSINLSAVKVKKELKVPEYLKRGFGVEVEAYLETSNKNIVLVKSEAEVRNLRPDYNVLRESDTFAYVVTAPGDELDFVSRTFVPHVRQLEDPATGSSHAVLTPYWSEKLGKTSLKSLQLSSRGGKFECFLQDETVVLRGEYNLIFAGETIL